MVTDDTLLKVYAWYDNEVGYACRMVDLANIVMREESLMSAVRNYAVVTASYWGFTLTDGALRMLVLLHFYSLGYTPFMLAFLFLLYEAAGIFANLGGGWLAARFGIPRMLMTGLTLQIAGLIMLSALNPGWDAALSVAWVVAAQGIAGVAKDITKTASKSAIKATSEGGSGQLFRWVAWFTGSKNAMKGIGFFVGGLLLRNRRLPWCAVADGGNARAVLILVNVLLSLPRTLGKAKSSKSFRELFAKTRSINLLAAARIFMFGSRDVWFVVGLPVFLYAHGWKYMQVAGFLAAWTIGYGFVQAVAPSVVRAQPRRSVARGAGSSVMGRGAYRYSSCARRCARQQPSAAARSRRHDRAWRLRLCLRRDLVAALLSDPCLCRIGESRRGCRLLLCGERGWAAHRHSAFGALTQCGRPRGLPVGIGGHAGAVPRDHLLVAIGDDGATSASVTDARPSSVIAAPSSNIR